MTVREQPTQNHAASQANAYGRRALAEALESRTLLSASYALSTVADLQFSNTTGARPYAGLIMDSDGNLYGTADQGGPSNYGSVFEIAAGSNSITTLALFSSSTGQYPASDLIMDASGNLYGTTQNGGTRNYGTIFELPAGSSSITTLASFNAVVGYRPYGGLIMDGSGNFYGVTLYGGANSDGTLYELPAGSGTITRLASFSSGTGYHPIGDLVMDGDGNLYGTTFYGGANGVGTVYTLPSGASAVTTLASFDSDSGNQPQAGLVRDADGNLYGTTSQGGAHSGGTVFELAAGAGTIAPLASLDSSTGTQSVAPLIMDSHGNLFGTAENGGANNYGTVFELPAGGSALTVLASMTADSGEYPIAGLVADSSGNLFGTAQSGGQYSAGTVFELTPIGATHNVITTQPTTVAAGTVQLVVVSLEDVGGNVDTSSAANVTLSIASGPSGATLGGTLTVTAVNGIATFPDLSFSQSGAYTLTASASDLTSATSTSITVHAGASAKLDFVQQPTGAAAGQSLGTVEVDVEDAFGNRVTTDNATVTLASGTGASLGGTTSAAAVNGVATFSDLSITTAHSDALQARATGLADATSQAFVITPAAAAKLDIVQQPSATVDAGETIGTVVVDVEDAYGNRVTNDSSTVTVSSSTALSGTTAATVRDGAATFSDLAIAASGTFTLTVTDGGLTPATSNPVTVADAGSVAIAGKALAPLVIDTVTMFSQPSANLKHILVRVERDDSGKTVLNKSIRTQDGQATISNLKVRKAGVYNVVVSDGHGQSMTSQVTVLPSAPAKLAFDRIQSPIHGDANVVVRAIDRYGNVSTGADGGAVSLRLLTYELVSGVPQPAGHATDLTGSTPATLVNGVATFQNVSISRPGLIQLIARTSGLEMGRSVLFRG